MQHLVFSVSVGVAFSGSYPLASHLCWVCPFVERMIPPCVLTCQQPSATSAMTVSRPDHDLIDVPKQMSYFPPASGAAPLRDKRSRPAFRQNALLRSSVIKVYGWCCILASRLE